MSKSEAPIPVQANSIDPSGLGVGFGLAVFGTLLLLFPLVLSVDYGWQTFIFVIAVVITVVGVGGIFFELAKHRARPWLTDIGTACVLLGLASAGLVLHVRAGLPYLADLILVLVLFALAGIGVIGLGIGLAKASHSRAVSVPTLQFAKGQAAASSERLGRNDKLNIGVAIACTVVQCAVAVILAVFTARPS